MAWDIGGRGSTVLRAGYGLYHDRLALFEFSPVIDNPLFSVSSIITPPAGRPLEGLPFLLDSPLPINPPDAPITIYVLDPKFTQQSEPGFEDGDDFSRWF